METTSTAVGTVAAATATPAAPAKFEYDGNRHFFAAAEQDKAQEMANAIQTQTAEDGTTPLYRVHVCQKEWPANAGFAILPLAKNIGPKGEQKRKTVGAVVWPVFYPDAIRAASGGDAYIAEVVLAYQANAIMNPVRKQDIEAEDLNWDSAPVELSDHIEGMEGEKGAIKSYMEACKIFIPILKKKHHSLNAIDARQLRLILSDARVARQLFPGMEKTGQWTGPVMNALIDITKQLGGNTDIYADWLKTRDKEEELAALDDLDLSDLSVTVPADKLKAASPAVAAAPQTQPAPAA